MGKLIKCHFYYLLNKLSIVILLLSIGSIIIFSLISASSFDERMNSLSISSEYYVSIYEVIKFTNFIIVIMLFGYSFSSNSDGYHAITINSKNGRIKYFISKEFLLMSVFTFIYLVVFALVIIIGLCFGIVLDKDMLLSFVYLYIILLYYGLFSTLLIILVDNIYIVFILVPLMLVNYAKNLYFLTFLFPLEDKTRIARILVLPVEYYLFILSVLNFIIIIIWNNKDLLH